MRVAASQDELHGEKETGEVLGDQGSQAKCARTVGQPKPEKIIESEPQRERGERRHKKTLADLLQRDE
jgi:hypothetical protein